MSNLTPVGFANVTADGVVSATPGSLVAVLLTAAGDQATIILYDNASAASGTKLATLKAAANTTAAWTPASPQVASLGIYADVTGTTPEATVLYT
jgi:hypothetical protein